MVEKSQFDLPPVPARNFKNGFYWVKLHDGIDWEPAWVQPDAIHGGLQATTITGHYSRTLDPPRDTVGHKIEREAPIVIPETKQLAEDVKFLMALVASWARHSEPDMHPTMYGTGSYKGDMEIVDRVNKIKESAEVVLYGKVKEKGEA